MYICTPGPCSISGSRKNCCTSSWHWQCCASSEFVRWGEACRLWIGSVGGKSYRDIPVHIPHQQLGPSKSLALPSFHSLTGCDTASHILGCGKKSGWNAWKNTPDRDIDCSFLRSGMIDSGKCAYKVHWTICCVDAQQDKPLHLWCQIIMYFSLAVAHKRISHQPKLHFSSTLRQLYCKPVLSESK